MSDPAKKGICLPTPTTPILLEEPSFAFPAFPKFHFVPRKGTVRALYPERGMGFIKCRNPKKDGNKEQEVFFHMNACMGEKIRVGDVVHFQLWEQQLSSTSPTTLSTNASFVMKAPFWTLRGCYDKEETMRHPPDRSRSPLRQRSRSPHRERSVSRDSSSSSSSSYKKKHRSKKYDKKKHKHHKKGR